MNRTIIIWLIIALAIISTGCSSIVKAEQPVVLDAVVLSETNSVGQTFKANFNGMNGIQVYLEPWKTGEGEIQLTLRDAPQTEILGRTSIPITAISDPGYYNFPLPVQVESNQRSYYMLLRAKGDGSVKVGSAPGNSYLNGALYQGGNPDDQRQMAFELRYYAPRLAQGLASELLLWGWYLLLAAFLFVLPGWAILDLVFFSSTEKIFWGSKLAISTGISLALYPIIFALTDFVGMHLGSLYTWLPPLIGLFVIIWQHRKRINLVSVRLLKISPGWLDITLIAIILIIFTARFWIIRLVEIPLWGDSLQHAMITQLILDNNGLFTSWQPYAPYYSLTTHFGISTFSALFAWITGMNGTQATLWIGQIINGVAILTLYPLAVKISRGNRWAGIGAMIIGGLISIIPAVYVNWGRFAQLAGQAVLPIALWLLWNVIDQEQRTLRSDWPLLVITGLSLTGMMLSYYRMPFYYVTFVAVLLLFWGLPKWRLKIKIWRNIILRLIIVGSIGLIFFLPWGIRLVGGNLANAVESGVSVGASSTRIAAELDIFHDTVDYFSSPFLVIIMIAALWGLIRKNWMAAALPLWFLLLIGYMVGAIIKLPGANMLQGFAILIALYIPIALLCGWLFGDMMQLIENYPSKWLLPGVTTLIILISVWFGWQQRLLLDIYRYQLVTPPDLRAMTWIGKETDSNAIFLVQSFPYLRTAAGSDAGWWMPLLADRANMLPPQYAQFNEISQPADFTQRVVDLVTLLQEKPIPDPVSIKALCDWGITHIYHGQGQGQTGGQPLYDPSDMSIAPETFKRVYHQDRISIFELIPEGCDR